MSLRSQTVYAIIVLLVALGAIFLLVGSGDVPTDVSLPESVVSSTPEPSLTPAAAVSADVWTLDETQEGMWVHTDEAGITARIVPESFDIEVLATRYQIEPPAENAPIPILDVLQKLRASLVTQLAITPDSPITFDEPAVRLFGGVPVALARLQFPVGSSADFPNGLDYGFALIDQGDNQVNFISYGREAEPDDAAYALFETWLEAHAPEIAQPEAAATEEAESAATEEAGAVGTEEAEPVGTEEPEVAVTEEAESAGTEEPEVVVTEEAGTEQPEAVGTEEAISVPPAERWIEVAPGQLLYSGSSTATAQIQYSVMELDQFLAQPGLEPPAADSETPILDILTQISELLQMQAAQQGVTIDPQQIEGPEMRDINGVQAAFLRAQLPAAPGDPATAFPGLDLVLVVFELGDGRINALQYVYQGTGGEAIYEDFLAWLDANITLLMTPPAEEPIPAVTEEATAEDGD